MTASALPDSEWFALEAGLKPALRTTVVSAFAERLVARAAQRGFAIVRASRTVQLAGRDAEEVLYVARSAAHARAVAEAEAPVLPGGPSRPPTADVVSAHTRLGALLGFPACCVAAFTARLERGVTARAPSRGGGHAHEDFVAAEDALAATGAPLGRLNNLHPDRVARLISFYPCRYDCPAAAAFALALWTAMARALPDGAAALRAALFTPSTIDFAGHRTTGAEAAPGAAITLSFARF